MTIKEALAWFAEELADGMCDDECVQCNANKKAYEALEKQIPKQPIDQAELGIATYICGECPVCGAPCRNDGRFCYLCGQALDWSECDG